jgi:hypothetical protein
VAVSALDASTVQVLRAKLEALEGVERVVVDESTPTIWVHCDPEANPSALNTAIDDAVRDVGVERSAATIHLLTDLAARRRVKFVGIERSLERDGHVRMRVGLEWGGDLKYGEAVGESGELIELRTSAAASLDALERVLNEQLGIKLVGVKQVRAFDVELMVVALYRPGDAPQRLVGSVVVGDQPRRAAAVAVLNALNRVLGNYLIVRE